MKIPGARPGCEPRCRATPYGEVGQVRRCPHGRVLLAHLRYGMHVYWQPLSPLLHPFRFWRTRTGP